MSALQISDVQAVLDLLKEFRNCRKGNPVERNEDMKERTQQDAGMWGHGAPADTIHEGKYIKQHPGARVYGYCRVSSQEQKEDRQLRALSALHIPKQQIYVDKQSGKDFARPQYRKLLRQLQPSDLVYVKSIDRLGRNYEEIQEQWRVITKEKGADIVILDMPLLDTRRGKDLLGTFLSDIVLQVLSFVAENERDTIRQRQAEGIAAAKARGVRFGRPPIPLPDEFEQVCQAWQRGEVTLRQGADRCHMALGTFYGKMKRWERSIHTP